MTAFVAGVVAWEQAKVVSDHTCMRWPFSRRISPRRRFLALYMEVAADRSLHRSASSECFIVCLGIKRDMKVSLGIAEPSPAPIGGVRILLVDDFVPWRQALRSMLQRHARFELVGEASDGLEAVCKAQQLNPDLVFMDVGLPFLDGVKAAERIRKSVPRAKILFLTQNNDENLTELVEKDSVAGYLLKTDVGLELLPAIDAVLCGDTFVSSRVKA